MRMPGAFAESWFCTTTHESGSYCSLKNDVCAQKTMLLVPSSEGSYPFDTGMVHKVIPTVGVVSVREGARQGIAITACWILFLYRTVRCLLYTQL